MSTSAAAINKEPEHSDSAEWESSDEEEIDEKETYTPKHALHVDGDPWGIMLKPELDADTARCNAWKEEVQTLLIFAGLFSAVVTAFVVESYKFLQPDPNTAVIGLLFHIANGLNSSSSFPPSVDLTSINTPFNQASSSIRVNVLWFLSLILSLTTVLIGTVSLQWLREHQSYSHFSSKEKVAILHMRLQALDAWYVPQIFAGLPLLLQGSLALFLVGMIDFALPLGHQLAIPVALIVGLTLFFLVITTILPSFQSLSLFIPNIVYPRASLPIPCPYKSPQSQVFRVLIGLIVTGFFRIFPRLAITQVSEGGCRININPLPASLNHLAPSIYSLWEKKNFQSWPTFDRIWISLRDACHQRIHDKDPDLYKHRQEWENQFPLSDVSQVLLEIAKEKPTAKHTKEFLSAVVLCFEDLSKSIWTAQRTSRDRSQRKDRRAKYLDDLFCHSRSVAMQFIHGGRYKFPQSDIVLGDYICENQKIFEWDQTHFFVQLLSDLHKSPDLHGYMIELWKQIMTVGHTRPHKLLDNDKPTLNILTDASMHRMARPKSFEFSTFANQQNYSNMADMLDAVFKGAASHRISKDKSLCAICVQSETLCAVRLLAYFTRDYCTIAISSKDRKQFQAVDARYALAFKFVSKTLHRDIVESRIRSTLATKTSNTPSALFYLACGFLWGVSRFPMSLSRLLRRPTTEFDRELIVLLEMVLLYRHRTSNPVNDMLEERLRQTDYVGFEWLGGEPDKSWWLDLVEFGWTLGLPVARKLAIAHSTSLQSVPPMGSEGIQHSHPETMTSKSAPVPAGQSNPASQSSSVKNPDVNLVHAATHQSDLDKAQETLSSECTGIAVEDSPQVNVTDSLKFKVTHDDDACRPHIAIDIESAGGIHAVVALDNADFTEPVNGSSENSHAGSAGEVSPSNNESQAGNAQQEMFNDKKLFLSFCASILRDALDFNTDSE